MPHDSSECVFLAAMHNKPALSNHRHLPGRGQSRGYRDSCHTLLWCEVHLVFGKDEAGKTMMEVSLVTVGKDASFQKFQFQRTTWELFPAQQPLSCRKSSVEAPTHWLMIGRHLWFNLTCIPYNIPASSAALCYFWPVRYGGSLRFRVWELWDFQGHHLGGGGRH